jgi:MOSC domain-containing protein YiiM
MATLKSICYKPTHDPSAKPAVGYLRVPLESATLIEGYGIEADRKGGNPKRQLNVMDDLTLAELEREGYPMGVGVLGENLVLSGIDLRALPKGTQLMIGHEAVIELGIPRDGCEQLTKLDERMPVNVDGRIGIMCRVVKSGMIRVGDSVKESVPLAVSQ